MEELLLMVVVLTFVSIATTIIMATVIVIVTAVNSINTNRLIKACSPTYQEFKARKREEKARRKENKLGRKATKKLNRQSFYLKVSKSMLLIQRAYLKSLIAIKYRIEARRYAKENTIRKEFIDMANEDAIRSKEMRRKENREAKTVNFDYVVNALRAELQSQDKEYKRERSYTIKSLLYVNIHGQHIIADSYIVGDHGAKLNLSDFCGLESSVAKEVDQYLFNYDVLKVINEKIGRDRGFQAPNDIDDELVFSHIKRGLDGFEKDAVQAPLVFKVPALKSELKIIADLYNPNVSHEDIMDEVATTVLSNEPKSNNINAIDVEEIDMEAVRKQEKELEDFQVKYIEYLIESTKDLTTGKPRIKYNKETGKFDSVERTPEEIQQSVNDAIGHTKETVDKILAITAVNGQPTQQYNNELHVIEAIHFMTEEEAEVKVAVIQDKVVDEIVKEEAKDSSRNEFNRMLSRIQKGEIIEELVQTYEACSSLSEVAVGLEDNRVVIGEGLIEGQSRPMTEVELEELDNIRTLN